ncbi:MAG: hypothetical protein IKQ94_07330 [Bacteroidales bacterium]|nr:hypothetical protein [Bacteroidales bacterium]
MNERHRKKRLTAWRFFIALPRSLWYNLRLLPFRQAIRMPILISHRTVVQNVSGKFILHPEKPRMGLVKIGFGTCQCTDFRHNRTILNLRGTFDILGECSLGAGSAVELAENAILTVGNKFNLGPKSLIICHRAMTFGNDFLTSWNCTFMDTDQHRLVDADGHVTNPDREIIVGNNVWFGCNCLVTKGTHLANSTTVAAGTSLHGTYTDTHVVLAGNPAKVVKNGVERLDN